MSPRVAHLRGLRTWLRYLRLRRVWLVLAGLVLLGLLWVVITGLVARQQLRKLEVSLEQVQSLVASGDLAHARQVAAQLPAQADEAHRLSSGPAWWLAAQVPYLGTPLRTVRGATGAAVTLGKDGVPNLLDVATLLDPSRLRVSGDAIDLHAISAAAPELARASAVFDQVTRRVDALPRRTWLAAVDRPRATLAGRLDTLAGYVDAAARATRILPTMLGADTPQRYFIGMQNEAEMRGTGGLPGAFAIAVVYHGQVRFTHFGSDSELEPASTDGKIKTDLDFGAGYNAAYGQSLPTASFLNSNVSPSFRYAGQIWARMWQRVSGEHVDGAIAVDPAVLGYVLGVTGPVQAADGVTVSAQNIVSLTERDEYALFSDNGARKAFLVSVLKASAHQLTSGRGSAAQLADQLVLASKQQRLQVWSADSGVQRELAATSYGAVIGPTARPLVGPVLNNLSGGKLDYYLTRTLTYHRSGCGDTRDVLVTLTLTNNAPASGLPTYVTDRFDVPPGTSRPGDYSTLLDYYATKGAQLLSVRRDGTPTTATQLSVDGQPVFRLQVPLPRGTTQTIELHLQEPAGSGSPAIWRQPGVTPMSVTAYSQSCS